MDGNGLYPTSARFGAFGWIPYIPSYTFGNTATSIHFFSHRSIMSTQSMQVTAQGPKVGPYVFGKTLGTGSSSKVKLAQNMETGEIVAIKIVRKDFLDRKPSLKVKMRREISVLKLLSHPNLMSLIDVFEIHTHLFLVMEFVDGVELFEYLVRRGALPAQEALNFFQQIICGLEYCHKRLICHRDLKPENILLDRHLNVKIADFGMTSLSRPGVFLETSCGSPHYCDPMVVSGAKYDGLKADIWSCGVILYAMVTGRLPFDDDNIQRLLKKVQVGNYHMPQNLPADLRNLISSMLTVDPDQRITLEQIKAHPWFNTVPPKPYVDDFVVPTDIVENPDPVMVKSLVDLGWGDDERIRAELTGPGGNVLKVFYAQLQRHPMSRRPRLNQGRPANGTATAAPKQDTAAVPVPNAAQNTAPAQGVPPADSAPAEGGEVRRPGRPEMRTSHSAPGWSGAGLIRQSSYTRLAGNGNGANGANGDPEEGIQQHLADGGQQPPSWFDSVRSYFARPDGAQANGETPTQGQAPGQVPIPGQAQAQIAAQAAPAANSAPVNPNSIAAPAVANTNTKTEEKGE